MAPQVRDPQRSHEYFFLLQRLKIRNGFDGEKICFTIKNLTSHLVSVTSSQTFSFLSSHLLTKMVWHSSPSFSSQTTGSKVDTSTQNSCAIKFILLQIFSIYSYVCLLLPDQRNSGPRQSYNKYFISHLS